MGPDRLRLPASTLTSADDERLSGEAMLLASCKFRNTPRPAEPAAAQSDRFGREVDVAVYG